MAGLYISLYHYIIYSYTDTLFLDPLDKKKGLILNKQLAIEGMTSWKTAFNPSNISVGNLKSIFFEDFNLVTQNSPNAYLNNIGKLEQFPLVGAYVTDIHIGGTKGVRRGTISVDASALYPSIMMTNNCFADKHLMTFQNSDLFTTMLMDPIKYLVQTNILQENFIQTQLLEIAKG